MNRRSKLIIAAALGLAVACGGASAAYAMYQGGGGDAAELRASGEAGEQADGYMGVVGGASGAIRSRVEAVNIKRRAYYTDLASKRGAKIEEVAATTACELLRTKVAPGQHYRLADGAWRKRDGAPVPLPSYCG